MQPSYTTFKGINNYNDAQLLTELENNLKYWLDWALLSIGGWTDVNRSDTRTFSPAKLNYIPEASGKIWQSARKDWVWETGLNYNESGNPIQVSGVYINGIFTTGCYIDYPLGRVVLNTAISTSSAVTANYSYKNVQVYKADDAPWWRELQFNSDPSTQFIQDPRTGDWSIAGYNRIQLPAIIMETVPRGTSKGYELGNGALITEQDMLFHILADNRVTRNNLTSMLFLQNDKTIYLFNTNTIAQGRIFPIDYRGTRVNNLNYPDLVSETGYRWKKCNFTKTNMAEVESINSRLFEGVVRTTLEVVFGNI
jgi:hypothetical protein